MRIIAILSLLFVISCGSQQSKQEEHVIDTAKPLVERIKLTDINGNEIALASLKGKTVFLNFWATWCKPCVKEMPSMDNAYKELQGDNFVFLAASDEGIERIKKFVSQVDFSFQFVQLQGDIFDLDIKALPTTFIINPDGQIVYNEIGAREWSTQDNIDMLINLSEQ